jgi:hypothetical protein
MRPGNDRYKVEISTDLITSSQIVGFRGFIRRITSRC